MRIALLEINATNSIGGVQTGVWSFATSLARAGHQVTVIGGNGLLRPDVGSRVTVVTFPFIGRARFPDLWLGFPFRKFAERFSLAVGRDARSTVGRGNFDWVILHKPLDFFWPWLPGVRGTAKFAFMSGGTDFMLFDRKLARRVRAFFSCSNFNAWQLWDHFGRMPKVTYNGVDTDMFSPRRGDMSWRVDAGCERDEVVFGFAGRLVDIKGLGFAIEALASRRLKERRLRLFFAGDGPERQRLEEMAHSLGVAERVVFVGAIPHKAIGSFYNCCDAGVFPSICDEAFGTSVAEAMSCGLPVVASHIGGIPEVVGNEELCGILVAPANAESLAAGMEMICDSAELRGRLGRNGRARVAGRFTWQQATQRLLEGLGEAATPRTACCGRNRSFAS